MVQYTNTKYLEQLKAWGAPKAPNSSNNNAILLFAFFAGVTIGYYLSIHKLKKPVYTSTPHLPLTNEMVSALSEKKQSLKFPKKNKNQ